MRCRAGALEECCLHNGPGSAEQRCALHRRTGTRGPSNNRFNLARAAPIVPAGAQAPDKTEGNSGDDVVAGMKEYR
jgi:hypothetical protein